MGAFCSMSIFVAGAQVGTDEVFPTPGMVTIIHLLGFVCVGEISERRLHVSRRGFNGYRKVVDGQSNVSRESLSTYG